METKQLIELAKEARKLSYSPYSNFAVGAVVLTKDGKIFKTESYYNPMTTYGLIRNMENASYPLCMCAERNALYNAYMNGYKKDDLVSLTLVADTDTPCTPCGACRQVISELFPKNAPINMANLKGEVLTMTIEELLPLSFSPEDLK